MIKVRLLAFLILVFLACKLEAADGCLLPDNIVYTSGTVINTLGFQTFQRGGSKVTLAVNYCSWTPTTGTACYVCSTITGLSCTDTPTQGIRSTNFQMVQCNLDDYSWSFGTIASIFAFFMIRRTRKSQLSLL